MASAGIQLHGCHGVSGTSLLYFCSSRDRLTSFARLFVEHPLIGLIHFSTVCTTQHRTWDKLERNDLLSEVFCHTRRRYLEKDSVIIILVVRLFYNFAESWASDLCVHSCYCIGDVEITWGALNGVVFKVVLERVRRENFPGIGQEFSRSSCCTSNCEAGNVDISCLVLLTKRPHKWYSQ